MKSADQIAKNIESNTRPIIHSTTKNLIYSTDSQGSFAFANLLLAKGNKRLSQKTKTERATILDGAITPDLSLLTSQQSIQFLLSAQNARSSYDPGKIDNIVNPNALLILAKLSSAPHTVNEYAKQAHGFADEFIVQALASKDPKDKECLKSLVEYGGQSNVFQEFSEFKKSLNKLIDGQATPEQLVGIFKADLGDEIDKKVITKLAAEHPETFKPMLADSKTRQKIREYKLTELEVGGESLLKSCMHNDELTAIMLKEGFTLSQKEIPKEYQNQNLTANDHIRIAIATKAKELNKLDLSQKMSPLALAREMGQTELAEALKNQGFKLKKTELMARKMKNALGEIKATFSSINNKLSSGKNKGEKGRG